MATVTQHIRISSVPYHAEVSAEDPDGTILDLTDCDCLDAPSRHH